MDFAASEELITFDNPSSYRIELIYNGNGLYDESEPWVNVPQSAIATGRDALNHF